LAKNRVRDRDAKIGSILEATKELIERNGYEGVKARDIARKAGVSVGLIYKYFPKGKLDIIKELGHRYIDGQLMMGQPGAIDFSDFPGYIRSVIKNMLAFQKSSAALVKALTVAALLEDGLVEDIKAIDKKDYEGIAEFFCAFRGVNISDKDPAEVLTLWSTTIKSIILYSVLFPALFNDEEYLCDILVRLSLEIWGYERQN